MEVESESDTDESENLSDLAFAKNCQNPTTLRCKFELCRIPT